MPELFPTVFGVLIVLCAVVRYFTRDTTQAQIEKNPAYLSFRNNYLTVYLIVMGADWLQGPYVYALYESYGYDRSQIAVLFIGGFVSSLVFGTFVGALADKYGRRMLCIFFGVIYSLSCLTKLVNDFIVLLAGRVLSGIATSLLFSSFESWMVSEHNSRNFPPALLSNTFSLATFGNGVVAILAGLLASFVADNTSFGYVAPFMMSLGFLVLGTIIVSATWTENYGDSTVDLAGTFTNALAAFRKDSKIAMLGMVQSLFEASMYTFVFMWTPALQTAWELKNEAVDLPFGLIFASYMVCIMIGSSLFGFLLKYMSIEIIVGHLMAVSAISLLVPIFFQDVVTVLISFLVFEVCCGIYFPAMGTLRGKYIPEATRSAVTNFFRVPLNFLVVIVLVKVGDLENSTVFAITAIWLSLGWLLQNLFIRKISAAY
eukprot:TRINITY_DN2976_c1_g1_i1.p1 TRINITY_DN2976_c1_g1~~TRINITY_DN2976_c1_g1_i1.p1  ORF type:complete len:430 (-),score=110.92 TRINITY_DN2976_c1_g1_i1:68-1357(-)